MHIFWLLTAIPASLGSPTSAMSCALLDPELVHCPAPQAPRITGLRVGAVTLELQIDPDGSVRSSKVLSASGHSAWASVAQAAVAQWRYSVASEPRTREVPFDFQLADP